MQNGNGQRHVIDRVDYSRSGEILIKAGPQNLQLDEKVGTFNLDRTFEVAFLTFKLTALADGAVVDPQPSTLDRFIKIRALDATRNSPIGDLPLVAVGDGSYRWTPQRPLLFDRGDCWLIWCISRESFDLAVDGKRKRVDQIRVEISFDGELLRYATVSDKTKFEAEAPLPG